MNEILDTRETKRIARNTVSCISYIEYNGNRYRIYTEGILKPTINNKALEINLLDEMTRRFDKLEKDLKNDIKNATEQTNARFDLMSQETNERFNLMSQEINSRLDLIENRLDLLENKLNNVIELNNLKV